ncbi:MAG: T9SS type A sorting domain-containing protein, partial [Bacteroidota bacterium]
QINLPVTFESNTVDYTLTDFGGNASVLSADPMNASNMVAKTTKTANAELWAGTTIGTNLGFASVIPFTATNHKMQVRVYSPDANVPVRLKAEVHGQPTQSVETQTLTTVANNWETLIFDFDVPAQGTAAFNPSFAYDMASIFFNFGTTGAVAGEKIYYFDDVAIFDITVGTNKQFESNEITIYPNPANNTISVNLKNNSTFNILDLTGRLVIASKVENNIIDISNLNKGVYILQTNSVNGTINTKFLKQ